MTDVFGNYVIQKFFEHGNEGQRQTLSQRMLGNVIKLSCDLHGCRCIQSALVWVSRDLQVEIVKE